MMDLIIVIFQIKNWNLYFVDKTNFEKFSKIKKFKNYFKILDFVILIDPIIIWFQSSKNKKFLIISFDLVEYCLIESQNTYLITAVDSPFFFTIVDKYFNLQYIDNLARHKSTKPLNFSSSTMNKNIKLISNFCLYHNKFIDNINKTFTAYNLTSNKCVLHSKLSYRFYDFKLSAVFMSDNENYMLICKIFEEFCAKLLNPKYFVNSASCIISNVYPNLCFLECLRKHKIAQIREKADSKIKYYPLILVIGENNTRLKVYKKSITIKMYET